MKTLWSTRCASTNSILPLCIVINVLFLTPYNDALIKYIDHNTFIKEKNKEVPQAYIKLTKGLKSHRKHWILYTLIGRKPKSVNNTKLKEMALSFGLNSQELLQLHWPEWTLEKHISPNVNLRLVRSYSIGYIGFIIIKCRNVSVTSLHSNNSHYRTDQCVWCVWWGFVRHVIPLRSKSFSLKL